MSTPKYASFEFPVLERSGITGYKEIGGVRDSKFHTYGSMSASRLVRKKDGEYAAKPVGLDEVLSRAESCGANIVALKAKQYSINGVYLFLGLDSANMPVFRGKTVADLKQFLLKKD